MALTNAILKAMGIESDQRDQIMAAHQETLESIKAERDELRDTAAKVPELERQIQEMKNAEPPKTYEDEYNSIKEEFEHYKSEVEAERAEEEKAKLYRTLLREEGVDEKRIESIMKVTDLKDIFVKDGVIQGVDDLKSAIAQEWEDFIIRTSTQGAEVDDPPTSGAGKTRDEIMAIKDTAERQNAIAENIELFK